MTSALRNVVHWGIQQSIPRQVDMCEICGKRPKFVERGFKHPYCSRSCARSTPGASPIVCAFDGCRATGRPVVAGFCSEAHQRDAMRLGQIKACSQCNKEPRGLGELCISCDRRSQGSSRLVELDTNGAIFKSVQSHFLSEWYAGPPPMAKKMYEVRVPRDAKARRAIYRKNLSASGALRELRTFHASQCICDMGTKSAAVCDFKSCGICQIIKSSFENFEFGIRQNTGRFGPGIYSYKNPKLADRFATSCTSSPYRVMIACDVLLGPGQSPNANNPFTADESVFATTADSVTPVYIIIYQS